MIRVTAAATMLSVDDPDNIFGDANVAMVGHDLFNFLFLLFFPSIL